MLAPNQSCQIRKGNTIFARALIAAIRGGVSSPQKEFSQLRELFSAVYRNIQQDIEKVINSSGRKAIVTDQTLIDDGKADGGAANPTKTKKDKDNDKGRGNEKGKDKGNTRDNNKERDKEKREKEYKGKGNQETKNVAAEVTSVSAEDKITQTPLLYLPHLDMEQFDFPLFYRCSPPPAPERPYVLKIGTHDVTLEWYNPPFDGQPPAKYRLFMRNVTRNFHFWNEMYSAGDITSTKFVVRDLPMGVACQFKVQAHNSGGWGDCSPETLYVTPGEDHDVLPASIRWKRLHMSGIWGIMDRMDLYPENRNEQFVGLKMIHGFALCDHGFRKLKLALKVVEISFHNLKTFIYDPEVISLAINNIGWCIQGKYERKVRQFVVQSNLDAMVTELLSRYRYHTAVVASVQWLRTGNMSKYITEIPEFKYRLLFPDEEEVKESDDSDDVDDTEEHKSEKPKEKHTTFRN
jgi:hypothetical protein